MDTPVPIPNTEVKHLSGDNSMACSCEDSTLPGYLGTHLSSFFLFIFFEKFYDFMIALLKIRSIM